MSSVPDEMQLNLFGVAEGTDKTFLANDYLRHYSRIFARYKHASINVLEIGVANGGSLRTWQRYFSHATIIGIDIQPRCREYAGDRMIVEIGSQADEAFLKEISEKYRPTIVIDDGSHISDHQIVSLECLFPLMPAAGIYVIEDMFFQVNPVTAATFGATTPLAVDYLCALARDRAGWIIPDPLAARRRSLIGSHMDRIEFFRGCAALFKHEIPLPAAAAIDVSVASIRDSVVDEAWRHLFNYAIRHPDHAEVAEAAAQKSLQIVGDRVLYHSRMSQVRMAQGLRDMAITEAQRALDFSVGTPHEARCRSDLDQLMAGSR